MRRITLVLLLAILATSTLEAQQIRRRARRGPTPPPTTAPVAGEALAGLTLAQRSAFADGLADFGSDEEVIDGLGPVFNERSCAACHSVPAVGGGSTRSVTRFARRANGTFDPLTNLGGSLMQDHAIGPPDGSTHRVLPGDRAAAGESRREAPHDAAVRPRPRRRDPDADFIALAQTQAARRDGTAGRTIGRQHSRGDEDGRQVRMEVAGAVARAVRGRCVRERAGHHQRDFPNESCPQGNCAELSVQSGAGAQRRRRRRRVAHELHDHARGAAARRAERDTRNGEATFKRIGCAACHVATLRTASNPVAALDPARHITRTRTFCCTTWARSATIWRWATPRGREMRTAPLWGLRFMTRYLHDGRATTLEQAVRRARRSGPRIARSLRRAYGRGESESHRVPAVVVTRLSSRA
jgi:cytochrome c551/c552